MNSSSSLPDTINSSTDTKDILSVKEALNEYFRLKLNYEIHIMINKKKILNNTTLSKREKRSEFLKLKPQCINCKRPGGTIFQTRFIPETDEEEPYRQYSASCGVVSNPCNLNIKIQMGNVEFLPSILNTLQNDIKSVKDKIIDYKNKSLFGYLTTEKVLNVFDDLKNEITSYTSFYESYFDLYMSIVENDNTKKELKETITNSYILINQIKDCIKKMNETNNVQYANDAVNIYVNTLEPLLKKTRELRYKENKVLYDVSYDRCTLIQNKHSLNDLYFSHFQDNVFQYNVGLEVDTRKKPAFIIESSSSQLSSEEKETGKFVMKTSSSDGSNKLSEEQKKIISEAVSNYVTQHRMQKIKIAPLILLADIKKWLRPIISETTSDAAISAFQDYFNSLVIEQQKEEEKKN